MAMCATALPEDLAALQANIDHERARHTTALSAHDEEIERRREQVQLLLANASDRRAGVWRGTALSWVCSTKPKWRRTPRSQYGYLRSTWNVWRIPLLFLSR